jgi:hypothetical protein
MQHVAATATARSLGSSPPYFLTPHTFFCENKKKAIFLDLRRDKYLAVDRALIDALTERGAKASIDVLGGEHKSEQAIASMIERGLVTTDASVGKPLRPHVGIEPRARIVVAPAVSWISLARHFVWFWMCVATSRRVTRSTHIRDVVGQIANAKKANTGSNDLTRLSYLIAVYQRLRMLYPRKFVCLYDSLMLERFLRKYGFHPELVFGVRFVPFEAHCWLQFGELTLNEDSFTAHSYTPIMAA